MAENDKLIDTAKLFEEKHSLTLPKRVRDVIDIRVKYRVLTFYLEENDEVSIGFKNENFALGSSSFYSSYQISIPEDVRRVLKIEKSSIIGFYKRGNKVFIKKM